MSVATPCSRAAAASRENMIEPRPRPCQGSATRKATSPRSGPVRYAAACAAIDGWPGEQRDECQVAGAWVVRERSRRAIPIDSSEETQVQRLRRDAVQKLAQRGLIARADRPHFDRRAVAEDRARRREGAGQMNYELSQRRSASTDECLTARDAPYSGRTYGGASSAPLTARRRREAANRRSRAARGVRWSLATETTSAAGARAGTRLALSRSSIGLRTRYCLSIKPAASDADPRSRCSRDAVLDGDLTSIADVPPSC
jgi:hypothetical protein